MSLVIVPLSTRLTLLSLGVASCLALPALPAAAAPVRPGVVVSDHPEASACGQEILARGGNAADAAVATALCAGVVQPAGSGLGGGGFAVIVDDRAPRGTVLDFREEAPSGATRDMYLGDDGAVVPGASREGGDAVAVPSESRGLARVLADHGSLPARVVARPARRLAARGFYVQAHLADALERAVGDQVRAEFQAAEGVAGLGDRVRRRALARTLSRWARTSGEDLATGAGARAIVAHVAASGGRLAAFDLQAYGVVERAPIVLGYRGHTVVTMPPPSSGGIALGQVLRALERHDLAELGFQSVAHLHLLTEALKHAYADRAHHLGDPDVVDVPVTELLGDARIDEIVAAFNPEHTLALEAYGERIAPHRDAGTQHISVVDEHGGAVSLTTTINTSFGSKLVVPSVGIVLNNEMDDFSAAPGVPNDYGLVGGEANAIAPGKRPLSSMTPTIVLDPEGRVELVIGASGGSTIITGTLQVLSAVIDFGLTPGQAVAAARIHHQWQPDLLFVEGYLPPEVRAGLAAKGHTLSVGPSFTAVQVIAVDERRSARGAADPRKGGRAADTW